MALEMSSTAPDEGFVCDEVSGERQELSNDQALSW
jgi:hypothetical protein